MTKYNFVDFCAYILANVSINLQTKRNLLKLLELPTCCQSLSVTLNTQMSHQKKSYSGLGVSASRCLCISCAATAGSHGSSLSAWVAWGYAPLVFWVEAGWCGVEWPGRCPYFSLSSCHASQGFQTRSHDTLSEKRVQNEYNCVLWGTVWTYVPQLDS